MDKHLLHAWSDAQYVYSISSTNVLFITITVRKDYHCIDKHLLHAWSDAQYVYSISSTNVLSIKLLYVKTTIVWPNYYCMHALQLLHVKTTTVWPCSMRMHTL